MKSSEHIRANLVETLTTARAHRGTETYLAMIRLLDAIDDMHCESLTVASAVEVPKIQGAVSQTRALRNALVNDHPNASPIG